MVNITGTGGQDGSESVVKVDRNIHIKAITIITFLKNLFEPVTILKLGKLYLAMMPKDNYQRNAGANRGKTLSVIIQKKCIGRCK